MVMRVGASLSAALALFWSAGPASGQSSQTPSIVVPEVKLGPKRAIQIEDLAGLRDIASLSVSPDGSRFAILVRQADADKNGYRTAWFVGTIKGDALTYVADGGEARRLVSTDGSTAGDLAGSVSRWSPDGQWIAFTALHDGEVQLWRVRADGAHAERLTNNPGDVRDFFWSSDGAKLLFTVDTPRSERMAMREAQNRAGTRLQDFRALREAIYGGERPVPLASDPLLFVISVADRTERRGTEEDKRAYEASLHARFSMTPGGTEVIAAGPARLVGPPVPRGDGAFAWLMRADEAQKGSQPELRPAASLTGKAEDRRVCEAAACLSQFILRLWWSADGREVIFLAVDAGPTRRDYALYAWSPETDKLRKILYESDAAFRDCDLQGRKIVCLRETRLQPRHVAVIDIASGTTTVAADVNPELRNLALGRVQRIEWDTPVHSTESGYAPRTRGYILYPPDYDPRKRYPVFIAPYSATGFIRGDAGDEHPLLVYAANGMVVLNSEFPLSWGKQRYCDSSACAFNMAYDPRKGYPHLRTLADSTFRGLDAAAKLASLDLTRVGIGGVSHGAFVPLYMLQTSDRLAALSVAGDSWDQREYYGSRLPYPDSFAPDPATYGPKDPVFWRGIDLAQHLDTIEAPILFHLPDREMLGSYQLMRDLSDAHLAYDAFVFTDEYHQKVQPAHRLAIYRRNLDWFRFWLMDREDVDPGKAEQYAYWRRLRVLQCRNPRSLRDYCNVQSAASLTAR